jgi:signal peptidase I
MFKILKVTGSSLSPLYREGDFVLVSKIPFLLNSIRVGDIIVFDQQDIGTMIKRVVEIYPDSGGYFVDGIHKDSLNSHQIGLIKKRAIIGKVIWHISRKS